MISFKVCSLCKVSEYLRIITEMTLSFPHWAVIRSVQRTLFVNILRDNSQISSQ